MADFVGGLGIVCLAASVARRFVDSSVYRTFVQQRASLVQWEYCPNAVDSPRAPQPPNCMGGSTALDSRSAVSISGVLLSVLPALRGRKCLIGSRAIGGPGH